MKRFQKRVKDFFTRHRKGICITLGVVGGVVLCYFGRKFYLKYPSLERIIKRSSLQELKCLRDKTHNEYLNYTENDGFRDDLWKILITFDKEIRKREGVGKGPSGLSIPREHGNNLYKPD